MSIIKKFVYPSLKGPFISPGRIGEFPILAGIGLLISLTILFQFNVDIIFGGFLVNFFSYIDMSGIKDKNKVVSILIITWHREM